jgi:hypothetical protein
MAGGGASATSVIWVEVGENVKGTSCEVTPLPSSSQRSSRDSTRRRDTDLPRELLFVCVSIPVRLRCLLPEKNATRAKVIASAVGDESGKVF